MDKYFPIESYSFDQLTESKPKQTYSKQQIHNIKLLSTNKKELAEPFGSATYRVQPFPGDLDLHEVFYGKYTLRDAVRKFANLIKGIAQDIKTNRLHYFSEMKTGLDKRYDVYIGDLKYGIFKPCPYLKIYSKALYEKNLLSKKEFKIIQKILSIPNPGGDEYDALKYIFREHMILRWTENEIIQGYKNLPGGIKMELEEALTMKTHVKIDMITLVNGIIVEVTNFWILVYVDHYGNNHMINIDFDYLDPEKTAIKYDEQLKDEIEKLYYSNQFYNPFKMVKRMWAYSRTFDLNSPIKVLSPIVSGDISKLYQIKSELDTIIRIFELNKNPVATINNQVDILKQKIVNILFIPSDDLEVIYEIIDEFIKETDNGKRKELIKIIKKFISSVVNIKTIQELDKIHYNPPRREFLPTQLKYAQILRGPYDVVESPLEKYDL